MSYKHNNLLAIRQNYWNDNTSPSVIDEKQFFQHTLIEHGIFQSPSQEDARYFFFNLPSIIIVKGYALGFKNPAVQHMITNFIQDNRQDLMNRQELKIQFRM